MRREMFSNSSALAAVLARCSALVFLFSLAAHMVAQGSQAPTAAQSRQTPMAVQSSQTPTAVQSDETPQDSEPPPSPARSGLLIRNISAYAVYYSNTLPGGSGYLGALELQSDLGAGGSAEVAWSKFGEHSTFSVSYTPSYIGRARYSSWNALNHALYLNASRKLAPRWSFNWFLNGELSTQEAFLFAPAVLSNVASVPASFDDLAGALLGSKSNNPQLASALASVPAQSPVRNLLYGARMFTAGGQASLSYRYSPRLTFTFSGTGGRTQHVSQQQSAESKYFLPDTTSASVDARISYVLSPFTQLSGSVTTSRIASRLFETQTTTTTAALGRTVARRWLLQIHGGVGITDYFRQQAGSLAATQAHPVFGGSLGYKTYSHTFLGSFDRTATDAYALGAASSLISSASWRWKRPDRAWWLESAVSWEQLQFVGQDTTGWRTSAGWGRSVGTHIVLLAQYAYLKYSGRFQNIANNVSQSAVRVSLMWTPHPDFIH